MKKLQREFGKHYLIELIDCNPERIKFVDDVRGLFLLAAEKSEATIVDHIFKQYEPYGVTGIILIAESHFSIHTWPEDNFVAVDILTCGAMQAQKAIDIIVEGFEAKEFNIQVVSRGY